MFGRRPDAKAHDTTPADDPATSAPSGKGHATPSRKQAEAQRNLGNQLTNIQATGQQNAYQSAQNQYNQAQNQMLQGASLLGQMGNQQYNQQMGIAQGNIAAGQGLQNIEQQIGNDIADVGRRLQEAQGAASEGQQQRAGAQAADRMRDLVRGLESVQERMQQESRAYQTLSNVMKVRHDTAKAAISNIH